MSDKCSQGVSIDKSGEVIENEIKSGAYGNAEVTVRACVSDDIHVIKVNIINLFSHSDFNLNS